MYVYVCKDVCMYVPIKPVSITFLIGGNSPHKAISREMTFLETADHGQGGSPLHILDYMMSKCRKLKPECLSYVLTYLRLIHKASSS
jgi:hypothetical protein